MTKQELFNLKIDAPNQELYKKIQDNWDGIAKPISGLGDFESVICRIGSILNTEKLTLDKKGLIIMCADNGVVEEGVSQTDKSVTKAVAELMGQNKSSVGIMSSVIKLNSCDDAMPIKVVDIGIDSDEEIPGVINKKISKGTNNLLIDYAMTENDCLAAINVGIQMVEQCKNEGFKIISTGEMGIGNTTTSSALLAALTKLPVRQVTGRGAGLSDEGLEKKNVVIESALRFHDLLDSPSDKVSAFTALYSVGGLDIAGLVGVFIGGAIYHIPIVIDGLISSVAALTAERLVPGVKEYCIPSHAGKEKGVEIVLNELGLKSFINGNMALGEGTGAIMMYPLLDMALALYNAGTAFADTDIGQYERFDKLGMK